MHRTQIYLPKTQQDALKREAVRRQTTVSAVIRHLVDKSLVQTRTEGGEKSRTGLLETLEEINKLGQKGPPDLATNLDEYLYGGKR